MRVYVHGNCQARAISALLSEAFPTWDVSSYEVFDRIIINEINTYYETVANADVIISQPVHDGYRDREDLSLGWVRAHAKQGTPIITFPSMFFDGQLIGWRSIRIPGYGMPYLDALVLHLTAMGVTAERIVAIVLDEEVYPAWFVEQEISLSISQMQRREVSDRIDVPLSPFLEQHARSTQLFHVINHPYRPALAEIANAILRKLGYSASIPFEGADCIQFPHVPLPPSTQKYLRDRGGHTASWEINESQTYHLPNERLTQHEYLMRTIEHFRSYPQSELMEQLRLPVVASFLLRLSKAAPSIPGIGIWDKGMGQD